jgi:hypothetical protein
MYRDITRKWWTFSSGFIAWIATLGAGCLPLWWAANQRRNVFALAPDVIVLDATLIALIWTTYHTYQGVRLNGEIAIAAQNQMQFNRETLFAGLASELDGLEANITTVEQSLITTPDLLQHPLLEASIMRFELLSQTEIEILVFTAGQLRQLQSEVTILETRLRALGQEAVLRDPGAMASYQPQVAERIRGRIKIVRDSVRAAGRILGPVGKRLAAERNQVGEIRSAMQVASQ